MQFLSYTEARSNLKSVLDKVNEDSNVAVVTRREGPAAVIMGQDHYESLMETLYLLSSPANAKRLMHSIEQAKRGETTERELIDE